MNQLSCEICGGTELLKESGTFVCQKCGAKYSIEEARKMMIDGVVDVKISRAEDISRIKKLADTAYKNETWPDAAKYYTQLLEIYDGDYESNFRCLVAKSNVTGKEFPSTQKSIEIVLDAFGNYREQLMCDENIQLINKKNIIINFFDGIKDSIWWIFNRHKNCETDPDGNKNTICFRYKYEDMIEYLEICIGLFYKLFEIMQYELELCPFIEEQFKCTLKSGLNLLSWYDFEYKRPESNGRYFGDTFNRFLNPSQKQKAEKFRKAILNYQKSLNDRYWNKHPNERKKLNVEKSTLNKKIEELRKAKNETISKIEEETNLLINKIDDDLTMKQKEMISQNLIAIKRINAEMDELYWFQFLRKQKLKDLIDELQENNKTLEKNIKSQKYSEINKVKKMKAVKIKEVQNNTIKNIDAYMRRIKNINDKLERTEFM